MPNARLCQPGLESIKNLERLAQALFALSATDRVTKPPECMERFVDIHEDNAAFPEPFLDVSD